MLTKSNPSRNGYSKPTRNADLRHRQAIGNQRAKADVSPAHNARCIANIIRKRIAEAQPIEDLGQYGLDDAAWSELVAILSPEELAAVNNASDETAPAPEPLSRSCFRSAVADVVSRAKATLPQAVNGRVEKAVQIVLSGDVEAMPDGSIMVGSQSDAAKCYYLVDGACGCPDSARADIEGWCKHRIAAAIWKRTVPLAQAQIEAQYSPRAPQPALPEAPASANCYVEMYGRKVQITLRDYDENRLLDRFEALLMRFPADDTPTKTPEANEDCLQLVA